MLPVSAAINHVLAQEAWARRQLQRHAGKIACIAAGPVELRLKVAADGMLDTSPQPAGEAAAVTIRVKPGDLPLIAQNRERAFSYVKIEGDAEFANAISSLSQSLRIEPEHELQRVVGPVAALRLAAGARAAFDTLRTGQRKLAENVAEFLLDEKEILPRQHLVQEFSSGVTRLRDDVERAAKRLARLEQKIAARPAVPPSPPLDSE